MATIGTLLYTFFKGTKVGEDRFGNSYYEAKAERNAIGLKKRWVIYKGTPEASKVPALWHSWLHYTTNELPDETKAPRYSWLKEHLPNLTGTKHAYMPPGDVNSGAKRAATVADYQPWNPN